MLNLHSIRERMKEIEDNKKERKTRAGAEKGGKISRPNQTAAASSCLSGAGIEVCVCLC